MSRVQLNELRLFIETTIVNGISEVLVEKLDKKLNQKLGSLHQNIDELVDIFGNIGNDVDGRELRIKRLERAHASYVSMNYLRLKA